jgi:hypothetical protein
MRDAPAEKVPSKLSPIEELFHKHMKRALSSYDEYYRKLREKWDRVSPPAARACTGPFGG